MVLPAGIEPASFPSEGNILSIERRKRSGYGYTINGRKMMYGMVHIRYADKKLFLSIMGAVHDLKKKMRRSYSGNYIAL